MAERHAVICDMGEGDDIRLVELVEGDALMAILAAKKAARGYSADLRRDGCVLPPPVEHLHIHEFSDRNYYFETGFPDHGIRWIVHEFI